MSQHLNFSRAAEQLCLTQSALSQRISQLEDCLGVKLFRRHQSSVELTDSGRKLLKYCRIKHSLESEVLEDIVYGNQQGLSGSVTIAGFSSIMRSAVMPILAKLVRNNPSIQLDLKIRDLHELPDMLFHSEADFIIGQIPIERLDYESVLLGDEHNILIQSTSDDAIVDVLLDHNIHDHFNEEYLVKKNLMFDFTRKRAFVNDIYGIIDGVKLGLGRGVVPKHLIEGIDGIKPVEGCSELSTPCLLQYPKQEYRSKLHLKVIEVLSENVNKMLNQ